MENLTLKQKIIAIIVIIIILVMGGICFIINYNENNKTEDYSFLEENIIEEEKTVKAENIVESESLVGVENNVEEIENVIVVHITGEVKKSGIVKLKQGSRIINAIEEAGGATEEANLDYINLAYVLEDGQKIYIPSEKEILDAEEKEKEIEYIISDNGNNSNVEGKSNNGGGNVKVNINEADLSELETLPGIGPSLAQRIIEYRKENGQFEKIEDIKTVKGIGDSKFEKIKENIVIK